MSQSQPWISLVRVNDDGAPRVNSTSLMRHQRLRGNVNVKSRRYFAVRMWIDAAKPRLRNFLRCECLSHASWLPPAISFVSLSLSFSRVITKTTRVIDVPSTGRKDERKKNERVENDPPEGTYIASLCFSVGSQLLSLSLLFPIPFATPLYREETFAKIIYNLNT